MKKVFTKPTQQQNVNCTRNFRQNAHVVIVVVIAQFVHIAIHMRKRFIEMQEIDLSHPRNGLQCL